ncbi:RlmE family RNA methyltransferase [Thalassospiraceae bacterium LMO-JJ14]|nr:RlmE family RNA methyltransferase [Thalassospiraceae bacterium LMO-JJ14]
MADKGTGKGGKKGTGNRGLHTRVKTAKGRRLSSTRWLQRQLNDPYVIEAKKLGYRSRAAFKLIELDDKFHFLSKGAKIIDLGAAPGGWTQVAMQRIGDKGHVVGIDLQEMEAIPGADMIEGDFLDDDAPDRLKELLGGAADIVLSDMAASSTGHPQTDHLRIMGLLEVAVDFAADVLKPGGTFVGKVLQGGTENELLAALKRDFRTVKHAKPPASRSDSAEVYVVAMGFRGGNEG